MGDSKRIFVLGAGSSIGHTNGQFPGIGDFFIHAKRNQITVESSSTKSVTEKYSQLSQFVQDHFGKSILETSGSINVEDVLTYLDIEIQRRASGELITINRQVKELIREVLLWQLPGASEQNEGEYYKFVNLLDATDSIVTFNWDLLLDRIFSEVSNSDEDLKRHQAGKAVLHQYQNFIDSFAIKEKDLLFQLTEMATDVKLHFPYTEWPQSQSFYLKAHGSVDWFTCINRGCRATGALFVVPEPRERYYCAECHEPLSNVLIPPVLNKPLNEYPVIRKIWNTAAQEMSIATELVIWGYSLPPTDFYSQWLLRQARQGNLVRLSIINPAVVNVGKETTRLNSSYVRHIYDLFRDRIGKDNLFLYESMADFANNVEIRDKFSLLSKRSGHPYSVI